MTLSDAILKNRLQRPYRFLASVGSTNDAAKGWLADGAPDGALVIANEQTQGRGRLGRTWLTPPDAALAISIILRPGSSRVSRVNLVGAMAVFDLATSVGCKEMAIKWPNDVLVGNRKVAGILPEVVWTNASACAVILGIGVNVRLDFGKTALGGGATNLENEVDRHLDRVDLLVSLLHYVDHWYTQLGESCLYQYWKSRLTTIGKRVNIGNLSGIATDVDPDGALLVSNDAGCITKVQAGDIFVIDDAGTRE